jgi:hypothetical protein
MQARPFSPNRLTQYSGFVLLLNSSIITEYSSCSPLFPKGWIIFSVLIERFERPEVNSSIVLGFIYLNVQFYIPSDLSRVWGLVDRVDVQGLCMGSSLDNLYLTAKGSAYLGSSLGCILCYIVLLKYLSHCGWSPCGQVKAVLRILI